MEVFRTNLMWRLFWGWVFPCISRIHTAYRWGFLHFRYLKSLVTFPKPRFYWNYEISIEKPSFRKKIWLHPHKTSCNLTCTNTHIFLTPPKNTWAVFKTFIGCLIEGIIIGQYKDHHKTISIMKCHKGFERWSHVFHLFSLTQHNFDGVLEAPCLEDGLLCSVSS